MTGVQLGHHTLVGTIPQLLLPLLPGPFASPVDGG
jgi:hypothetical protein